MNEVQSHIAFEDSICIKYLSEYKRYFELFQIKKSSKIIAVRVVCLLIPIFYIKSCQSLFEEGTCQKQFRVKQLPQKVDKDFNERKYCDNWVTIIKTHGIIIHDRQIKLCQRQSFLDKIISSNIWSIVIFFMVVRLNLHTCPLCAKRRTHWVSKKLIFIKFCSWFPWTHSKNTKISGII